MIQKISKPGKGFRGVLGYCLDRDKNPEIVASTMAGEDPRSLAAEFRAAREGNEAVQKPVFHASLSAHSADRVTAGQWQAIAQEYMQRMGYGDSLWVAIRHRDTKHDHIHLIASRVAHDGSRVHDSFERKRGEEIVRDLERQHGLVCLAPSREASRAAVSRDELAAFERAGTVSVKVRLQEHLDLAARPDNYNELPTMAKFAERLRAQGVQVRVNLASTGHVSGISFELDGVAMKGSNLGRAYSWRGLQDKKGVQYRADRDLPVLCEDYKPDKTAVDDRTALSRTPMPRLENPVTGLREAAVLTTRMDLHDRLEDFAADEREADGICVSASRFLEDRGWTKNRLNQEEGSVYVLLDRSYEKPQEVADRLRKLVDRHGYEFAARVMEQTPGALGRLQGFGVAGLQTKVRREAIAFASRLGVALREVGQERDELARTEPKARRMATTRTRANRLSVRLARIGSRLPPREVLQRDTVRSAQALGMATVSAISVRVVRAVVRFAESLAREEREQARARDFYLGR